MKAGQPMPPLLLLRFFRWYCHPKLRDHIEGDLLEVYQRRVTKVGKRKADFKFLVEVVLLFRIGIIKPLSGHSRLNNYGILKNYFVIAWRNVRKSKGYSAINILGLSLGLTCCMLLLLYTADEITYDQFHERKDNIFQLTVNRREKDGDGKNFSIAAMVQGPAFKREIPEIESFTRVRHQTLTIKNKTEVFQEDITWADDNFFTLFSFPLRQGNPTLVLKDLHSAVLTEESALRYFNTIDAVGKSFEVEVGGEFETFIVSGITREAPQNSSIKFKILLPFSYLEQVQPDNGWHWVSFPTYFVLHKGGQVADIISKMEEVYQIQAAQEIEEMKLMGYGDTFKWGLSPFVSMHLNTDFEGTPEASKPVYSYILTGIALFILIIACINFVNIAVAQSIKRGKEIGIRKVMGSQRIQLVQQFLGESALLCLISFLLAICFAQFALPFFNQLSNKNLDLSFLFGRTQVFAGALLFVATVLCTGIYPAMILSRLEPIKTFYLAKGPQKGYLSKTLVVMQFAMSTFLIISTLFLYSQFSLLTKTNLGYNEKNLIELTVGKAVMDRALSGRLKNVLINTPGVDEIAQKNIGKFGGPTTANDHEVIAVYDHVDTDYLSTLQIPIVSGRNFSQQFPADSSNAVLVNETFVREVGWKEPIGQTINSMNLPGWGNRQVSVIGVVKDHHFESLREKIKPQLFTLENKLPLGKFFVRVSGQKVPETLRQLEIAFHKELPNEVFQYQFVEDANAHRYQSESRWKQLITIASIIAILISCVGLLGITALAIEKRTKEIGVRKVLGASSLQILALASKDFFGMIVIGLLIASPLAWKAIDVWLQGFAYRIEMNTWVFAAAGLIAIGLGAVAIGVQAFRAIKNNPVESLRQE